MKGMRNVPSPKIVRAQVPREDREIDITDVEIFLQAEGEEDFDNLYRRYGSLESLFGKVPEDADGQYGASYPGHPATLADVENLSGLMLAALDLMYLMDLDVDANKTPLLSWVEFFSDSRARVEDGSGDPRKIARLRIELANSPHSLSFIRKGVEAAGIDADDLGLAELFISDRIEDDSLLVISSTVRPPFEHVERRCFERMLDTLSRIVLQDVDFLIRDGELCIVPRSIASSLWLCLLEGGQSYRARRCKVCGKPFIAVNERKNKRVFCSQACRTRHFRLQSFNDCVKNGVSVEEAAKKAKIDLDTAVQYWQFHEPDWLDDQKL